MYFITDFYDCYSKFILIDDLKSHIMNTVPWFDWKPLNVSCSYKTQNIVTFLKIECLVLLGRDLSINLIRENKTIRMWQFENSTFLITVHLFQISVISMHKWNHTQHLQEHLTRGYRRVMSPNEITWTLNAP